MDLEVFHHYAVLLERVKDVLTGYTAEEPEAGCSVSLVAVHHSLSRERRHRDGHGDGLVKLSPARLHCHYRTEGCPIPYDSLHNFIWNRLSLSNNHNLQIVSIVTKQNCKRDFKLVLKHVYKSTS